MQLPEKIRQEDIPGLIAQNDAEFDENQRQKVRLLKYREIIQDSCSHPSKYSGSTMGRWDYTKCNICKKEW